MQILQKSRTQTHPRTDRTPVFLSFFRSSSIVLLRIVSDKGVKMNNCVDGQTKHVITGAANQLSMGPQNIGFDEQSAEIVNVWVKELSDTFQNVKMDVKTTRTIDGWVDKLTSPWTWFKVVFVVLALILVFLYVLQQLQIIPTW